MNGPLRGRRVVVTRPRERADALVDALGAAGAEVILAPTIEVVPPADQGPLAGAASRLTAYDWVVFTSGYGVSALMAAGARPGAARGVACVGEPTARAAREAGFGVALVPAGEATGGALAQALVAAGAGPGTKVLFPRASDAREELPDALRRAGVEVDEVVAYVKRPVAPDPALAAALRTGSVDVVTFTSPSTVRAFAVAYGALPAGAAVVVIGETTAAAARGAGVRVDRVAAESSAAGVARAVVELFEGSG